MTYDDIFLKTLKLQGFSVRQPKVDFYTEIQQSICKEMSIYIVLQKKMLQKKICKKKIAKKNCKKNAKQLKILATFRRVSKARATRRHYVKCG